MDFIADFHIHSKYSRATAADLDFCHLYAGAQIKGIRLLGTGDFTHPAWWREINEALEPAEAGLFALKPELARHVDPALPELCRAAVRFMLVTEISNIYKKAGRTRKNHNLVFMPDMDAAERFRQKLDRIGNLRSDGRPILGLPARDLLEVVLESSPQGYLVPAHIWTPWFSLLGSKSGFDTVEECFEDLSEYIFALETGLSSDPPMNRRVSALDRYTLISNSDAHSPAKLGREANRFDCALSYAAVRAALDKSGPGFCGTLEFFPEEGKYHLDGHRKCNIRSLPAQTRASRELCPACGKPLTLGVLYRVEALADRSEAVQPEGSAGFEHLVPLTDLLAEVLQTGPQSKRVARNYEALLQHLGSELDILRTVKIESIAACGQPLVAEAVRRMRKGRLRFEPGFDGVFGRLRLFDPDERLALCGQNSLFEIRCSQPQTEASCSQASRSRVPKVDQWSVDPAVLGESAVSLNTEQQVALEHGAGPLMIVAGPGTGKTRTITCRMAALIKDGQVSAENILAVTFTNRAADEMRTRVAAMLGPEASLPLIATFHGLCWRLLREFGALPHGASIADEALRRAVLQDALYLRKGSGGTAAPALDSVLEMIIKAKQRLLMPQDDLEGLSGPIQGAVLARIYGIYQNLLELQKLYDFEDLILITVRHLTEKHRLREEMRRRFSHIFVDEFQDINEGQYALLRNMAAPDAHLCVIGDPDQSIYGFRGSDVRYFNCLEEDYSGVRVIRLARNYRSTETILCSAAQVIDAGGRDASAGRTYSDIGGYEAITILESTTAHAEAVAIGRSIEALMGGTGYHALGFGSAGDLNQSAALSFSDFAVLYRTGEQGTLFAETLEKAGLACQRTDRAQWRKQKVAARLLALMRMFAEQGSYADLTPLSDLISPGLGKETLSLFKAWAYGKRLSLSMALRAALRLPLPDLSLARQKRMAQLIRRIGELQQETARMTVSQTIAHLAIRLGGEEYPEAVTRLTAAADPFGSDMTAFLAAIALQQDTDLYHPRAEKIALLTMHAAKGLEFPVVYIAGCETGLIPFQRQDERVDTAEERRLFYVAMTRAGRRLFLSWAHKRSRYGRLVQCRPSPFLKDIEARLKESESRPRIRCAPAQLELF